MNELSSIDYNEHTSAIYVIDYSVLFNDAPDIIIIIIDAYRFSIITIIIIIIF